MNDLKELLRLKETTWNALKGYSLDSGDSRNVSRYEKLSKLYLQLAKQVARMKDPNEEKEELLI